jgi:hypothetical protein
VVIWTLRSLKADDDGDGPWHEKWLFTFSEVTPNSIDAPFVTTKCSCDRRFTALQLELVTPGSFFKALGLGTFCHIDSASVYRCLESHVPLIPSTRRKLFFHWHLYHITCICPNSDTVQSPPLALSLGALGDQVLLLKIIDNDLDGLSDIDLVRPDMDLWLLGSLVRSRNPGEL